MENIFIPNYKNTLPEYGSFTKRACSNIALIKYWGKHADQIPTNASLSFTLTNCFTETKLSFSARENFEKTFDIQLVFDGKPAPNFLPKIETFFSRIENFLPFLKKYSWAIDTYNSFPHSSGIASSASAMAALSLALMEIENEIQPNQSDFFYKKASFLARLGSGSAARSTHGSVVLWGENPAIAEGSNLYGIPYPQKIDPIFLSFRDTILLIDKGEKRVSSSQGHNLMHQNPFANSRFAQAQQRIGELIPILENGDLPNFIKLIESEALTLHAMMMTSSPYYLLMRPNTLNAIERIWNFRQETNLPVGFTLDAGANIHLLYPQKIENEVLDFINSQLKELCQNGQFIQDCVNDSY